MVPKLQLFKELANYNHTTKMSRIVFTSEFVYEYTSLQLGNGGSWCRRSNTQKYKIVTFKNNGKFNFLWDIEEHEKKIIIKNFKNIEISNGNSIKCIQIVGEKTQDLSRNIRIDIKQFYKHTPCCACGRSSDLVCDHKNDLYNDPRVLDTKTQTIDDFQSLCNSCNLQKRQICKKSKETNTRYSAINIPSLRIFDVDFTYGNEILDVTEIYAMKGTYWYDPIDFMTRVFQGLSKHKQGQSRIP